MSLSEVRERFNRKWTANNDGCWEWTAYRNNRGYGTFSLDGSMKLAHRVSYTLFVGPIADGMVVDHLCDTPACVNPDHLRATTQRANVRRAVADKTHCVNGHALEGRNLGIRSATGWRFCRTCANANSSASKQRRNTLTIKE